MENVEMPLEFNICRGKFVKRNLDVLELPARRLSGSPEQDSSRAFSQEAT